MSLPWSLPFEDPLQTYCTKPGVQTKKNLDYKQRAHIDIAHNQSVEIIRVYDREYPCRAA